MVLGKRLASAFRGMKVGKLQTSWIKMHFLYYCSVGQRYMGKLVIDFFLIWVFSLGGSQTVFSKQNIRVFCYVEF